MNTFLSYEDYKIIYECGVRNFTFDNLKDVMEFEKYANTKDVILNIRISINDIINEKSYIGTTKVEYEKIYNYTRNNFKEFNVSLYLPQYIDSHKDKLKDALSKINQLNSNKVILGGVPQEIDLDYINDKYNLEIGQNLLNDVMDMRLEIIKIYDDKIIISNGVYGGFLDKILYNKSFEFYIQEKDKREYIKNNGNIPFLICGPTGDTLDCINDYLFNNEMINNLKNAKYIYVKNIGAYTNVFIMSYNNNFQFNYKIKE